jgi:hypothetical protein
VTSLDDRADELVADRRHGAGYLARRALDLLAAARGEGRHRLAAELIRTQRPAMPAIAAAVDELLRGLWQNSERDGRGSLLDAIAGFVKMAARGERSAGMSSRPPACSERGSHDLPALRLQHRR